MSQLANPIVSNDDADTNATATNSETTGAAETSQPMELGSSLDDAAEDVKARILHLLDIYPYISRAMIQTGLSPALPPKLWDPVLQHLVNTGEISHVEIQATTPGGRALSKGIYHLPKFPYPVVTCAQLELLIAEAQIEVDPT